MLFPKKQVYPLIVPQICFNDKYNNTNSFVEMNPSLHVSETGKITILIRCVNYRKFFDKQFTMYEHHSYSHYYILRGRIQHGEQLDIENYSINRLSHEYFRPTYPSYWKGVEDIRFLNEKQIIAIVPECNPSGNPSLFCATLEGSLLQSFIECKPSIVEKNWMPFDTNKVIYSLDPFIVKDVLEDNKTEIRVSYETKIQLKGFHGSTNGVKYDDKYMLFLIHVNRDKVYHKWLLFNPNTHEMKMSCEFVFFSHTYIEFTCSLCRYEDRFFTSIGVNDDKAYIIETDMTTIDTFINLS
jgi:hypothetical protein